MSDDLQFSAGGIVLHRGRILLIETRKQRWQLPKGHLEPGETPPQAAVREVREETGAEVSVLEPAGCVEYRFRGPDGRYVFKHVDYYLCAYRRTLDDRGDPREVLSTAWHPLESALDRLHFDNERELVRRAIERTGGARPERAAARHAGAAEARRR